MAETIAKRTYPHYENVKLELFKRNDGTHRIKYTGANGHELVVKVSQQKGNGFPEDEFDWLLKDIEREWEKNREQYKGGDRYDCNLHEFQWIVVSQILVLMNDTICGGARYFTEITANNPLSNGVFPPIRTNISTQ